MKIQHLAMAAAVMALATTSCKDENEDEPVQIAEPVQEFGPGQKDEYQPSTPVPGRPMFSTEQLRRSCPMMVEGTDVEATDLENGIALTFTTKEGDVAALRNRVTRMADMYERKSVPPGRHAILWHRVMMGADTPPGPEWMHERGHHQAQGGDEPMPTVKATATQLEDGARLILQPVDVSQLTELRQHIRADQERMQSGECWMLREGEAENSPAQ